MKTTLNLDDADSTVLPPLPVHHLGSMPVDLSDRAALHDLMDAGD